MVAHPDLAQFWVFVSSMAEAVSSELIGLVFSLILAFALYVSRLRPKLVYARPHASLHLLNIANKAASPPEEDNLLEIYNEQFFILNEGRRAAKDVDVVLSYFPRNISINPSQKVTFESLENGNCLVKIPYIAARELITLDCVYLNQRAAFIVSVRCAESVGKFVDFLTVRKFSNGVYWMLWLLMFLGIAFVAQLIVQLGMA